MADMTKERIAELRRECELMRTGNAKFEVGEVLALLDMATVSQARLEAFGVAAQGEAMAIKARATDGRLVAPVVAAARWWNRNDNDPKRASRLAAAVQKLERDLKEAAGARGRKG